MQSVSAQFETCHQWRSGGSVRPQVSDLWPQMILSTLDKYCSAVPSVQHVLIFPYYLIHHSFKKSKATQVQLLITQHMIYHLFSSVAHSTEACSSAAPTSHHWWTSAWTHSQKTADLCELGLLTWTDIILTNCYKLEWHSVDCIPQPRPSIPLTMWICTTLHTLINISSLNMLNFSYHREPWIIIWEINKNNDKWWSYLLMLKNVEKYCGSTPWSGSIPK